MANSLQGTEKASSLKLSAPFLFIITLGYAVYAVDRTVLSAVLAPVSSSLALTNPEIGLLSAAQYIGVTCVVFLSGYLSDRYGRWPMMIGGVAVFSAFTWLIGFSSSFSEAFLFRLVSGFGEGAFWPVAMASAADYFRARKGFALGIFYVGFDAGSVAGLSIGGIAYSLSGMWNTAFFIAPLIGVFVLVGMLLARKRLPLSSTDGTRISLGRDALRLLRKRGVIIIMIFAFLATWSSVWQVVFLPFYFFKEMHFTVLSSSLLSSVVTLTGMFGKVIFGRVSDSIRRNGLLIAVSVATLASYAIFFFSSFGFAVNFAAALSMGFFSASIFPVMQALMADLGGGRTTGSALGLSTSSQSIATIFSPIIAASLFTIGVGRALALGAMLPLGLALVCLVFLREPRSRAIGEGE